MTRRERLQKLYAKWDDCRKCELGSSRKNLVLYRGSPMSRLVVIGEAPGADEDEQGQPFVGLAGKTLDKLFKSAGLSPKKDVFITNMLACRPLGNRKPAREETIACRPRLLQVLKIVKPKCLLLLGATAAKLAGVPSISGWRGDIVEVELPGGLVFESVPTFHPSYLNRLGGKKEIRDLMVKDIMLASHIANK